MTTKYPKIWTGSSNPGEALVRELQRNEAPFLTARGVDYIARKKGEFQEVETGVDDGIYSIGTLDSDVLSTNNVTSGTPDIRARFGNRGAFSGAGFSLTNINLSGNGKGIVPRTSGGLTYVYHTRYATDFRQILVFSFVADTVSLQHGVAWRFIRGAMVRPDPEEPRRNTFGFTIRTFQNSQWFFVYIYTMDGGRTWQSSSVGVGGGIEVGVPNIRRLSPNELFGFLPVYVGPNNTDRFASMFLYSSDNGVTWVAYSAFSMLQNAGLSLGNTGNVNNRLSLMRSSFNATRTVTGDLVFATAFAWQQGDAGLPSIHIFRSANFPATFAPAHVHSVVSQPHPNFLPNTISNEFGVVGDTPYGVARTAVGTFSYGSSPAPVLLRGDPSGVVWTETVLPYKQVDFGAVYGYDARTLMVPIFEAGENRVRAYLSTDAGETYIPAGIVRSGVPAYTINELAPDPILRRFGVLSMLRYNGAPANTFPSSPWVGDDRFPKPWETPP